MDLQKDSKEKADFRIWIEQLKDAGFTVVERGSGAVLVTKYGCGAVFETAPSGEPQFAVRPGLLVGDQLVHLVDRGFQKFWQDDHRSFPALAEQLKALHRFQQDLRALMGLTTLYNEALGTVSARYVYDRLEGREEPKRHQSFD